MFNLQVASDRPAKISSQLSEHILRVRLLPTGDRTQSIPLQLAVALDTSASMQGEKWEQARVAFQELVAQLRPCDHLSFAGFADWVTPLAQNLPGHQLDNLRSILDPFVAEGVTRTDLALNWVRSALSLEPGRVRVGILITDGHPTTAQGEILEDVTPLIKQAEAMAAEGITLCTVGLGDAANFNSAFLVSLSDRGQGRFLYADNPSRLITQLQDCLQKVQMIAVEDAILKLNLPAGVKLKSCCQFRPEYLPLAETDPQKIRLRNLQANTSTDVLLALEVPALNPSQLPGTYTIAQIQLQILEFAPVTAQAVLKFTPSYQEAQQINLEVDRDHLCWDINRFSTELTVVDDPLQTCELLSHIQASALKSGQIAIAEQATQQLDNLYKTGKLSAHQTTGLLRATRQMGDV